MEGSMYWKAIQIVSCANLFFLLAVWNVSLKELWRSLKLHFFMKKHDVTTLVTDLVTFARLFPVHSDAMREVAIQSKSPYFYEGYTLLMEGVLDPKSLERSLQSRTDFYMKTHHKQVKKLRLMARLSAFMGLAGVLMYPEMAAPVLMVSAAYCYLFFLPISDWLLGKMEEEAQARKLIMEGLTLINSRTNPVVVGEILKAYLPEGEKRQWAAPALTHSKSKNKAS